MRSNAEPTLTIQQLPVDPETAVFSQLLALSDPIRCRLLLAVEGQELSVRELQQILQLPQSTVSRHLKVLSDEGWVTSRSSGPSNWYRMEDRQLSPSAADLWRIVREQARLSAPALRDAERTSAVLASRQDRSREFFAATAGQWDRVRSELFGSAATLGPLLGLLDEGWVVADLGAGTGSLTELVAPHVRRVIAIDDSDPMLDLARQRLIGLANVEIRTGSLHSIPLDDESIDLAFIVCVLHHIADPEAALREVARVLRVGGRAVIVDMAPHERSEYRELMGHQWLGFAKHDMERWCAAVGLGLPTYRTVRPDPDAKGPTLFTALTKKTD